MKKLLSLMAALGLTATGTAAVVACGTEEDTNNQNSDNNPDNNVDSVALVGEQKIDISLTNEVTTSTINISNFAEADDIDAVSSNVDFATVQYDKATGEVVITAVAGGTTTITVSSASLNAKIEISVTITGIEAPQGTNEMTLTSSTEDSWDATTNTLTVKTSNNVGSNVIAISGDNINLSTLEYSLSGNDMVINGSEGSIIVTADTLTTDGHLNIVVSAATTATDNKITLNGLDNDGYKLVPLEITLSIVNS